MDKTTKNSSFVEFFCNYGEFHHNKINQLIHIIFIPVISFTLFFITEKCTTLYSFPEGSLLELININFGALLVMVASILYISIDLVCGVS